MTHHASHHGHQNKKSGDTGPTLSSATTPAIASDQRTHAAGEMTSPTDRVRRRAYEISQSRNGGPGDAVADWCQAEREVATQRDVPR